MHRIYITAVPLDDNFLVDLHDIRDEEGWIGTSMAKAYFPISPIVESSLKEGDIPTVIAFVQDIGSSKQNISILTEELKSIGVSEQRIMLVSVGRNNDRQDFIKALKSCIYYFTDHTCYYACMTFGTKAFPLLLSCVLTYADRAFSDTVVKTICYRDVTRKEGKAVSSSIKNMTSLFTVASVINSVSDLSLEDPSETIASLLGDFI